MYLAKITFLLREKALSFDKLKIFHRKTSVANSAVYCIEYFQLPGMTCALSFCSGLEVRGYFLSGV